MNIKHYKLIVIFVFCLSTIVACGGGGSHTSGSDEEDQQNDEESDDPQVTDAGGSEDDTTNSDTEVKIDSDVVGVVSLSTLKTISAMEELNSTVDMVMASFAGTADGEETTETVKAFFNIAESSCTAVAIDEIEDNAVVDDSTELSAGLLSVTGDDAFTIAPDLDGLTSTYFGSSLENPDVTLRAGAEYTVIFSGANNSDAVVVIPEFTIGEMSLQGDDDLLVGKTPLESFIQSNEPVEIDNLKNLNWQAMEGMATGSSAATQYGKQLLTIFTIEEDETNAKAIYCYIDPNESDLKNALANSSSSTLIEDTLHDSANGEAIPLQISFHQVHAKLDEVNLSLPEVGTALVYTTAGGTVNYIVTAE